MNFNFIFLLILGLSLKLQAQISCSELATDSINKIGLNEVLTAETQIKDKPWPQVTSYTRISATAQQALAVFADFNEHKNFFPDLIDSKINSDFTGPGYSVSYKMKLTWPLADEDYTVHDTINVLKKDRSSLSMNWESTKTTQVKSISGFITFEKVNDFICMTYSNLVDPGSTPGLSILKSLTVAKTKEAVHAFQKQIDLLLKPENKEKLQAEVLFLEKALKKN